MVVYSAFVSTPTTCHKYRRLKEKKKGGKGTYVVTPPNSSIIRTTHAPTVQRFVGWFPLVDATTGKVFDARDHGVDGCIAKVEAVAFEGRVFEVVPFGKCCAVCALSGAGGAGGGIERWQVSGGWCLGECIDVHEFGYWVWW